MAVAATLQQAEGAAFVYQALTGGLKLFLFGLGQGALILLTGTFAGLLTRLPKSGKWMVTVKKAFAMLVLAGASLLLVYVGQATGFPDLTRLLARAETKPAEVSTELSQPIEDSRFGGDEFLE